MYKFSIKIKEEKLRNAFPCRRKYTTFLRNNELIKKK